MKVSQLRELSSDELVQKEKAFKKELFELNFQKRMGNVEKPARFKNLKKDISKILTILRERELSQKRNS